MNGKWSRQAWEAARPIYEKILEHPFVRQLADGTLDRERFLFYVRQDALYLRHYSRRLLNVAARLTDKEQIESFILFASRGVRMEEVLHAGFLGGEPLPGESAMSPGCMLYTSVLDARTADPVEVAAASVLPCFWVYRNVGTAIRAGHNSATNPYRAWIETYSDAEFDSWTERAVEICDSLAERTTEEMRRRMTDMFVLCTKMEWMFWDSAWRMEQWPV